MPTPTGMKYHSVLDLPNAIRNLDVNLGRCLDCSEYARRLAGLRANWRLGEACLGLRDVWWRACRRKQAGQRRTAADSSKSLLLARPLPRDLDIEAIMAQEKAARRIEPTRWWKFKQDGEKPWLIDIDMGRPDPSYDRGAWVCGEGQGCGTGLGDGAGETETETEECQQYSANRVEVMSA